MATKYEYAEDVKKIAEELIEKLDKFSHIDIDTINFIRTSKHIKSDFVLGQTMLLNDLMEFLTGKKFIIQVPPVFDTLTKEQKSITIEHELHHLPTKDDKGLIQHDVGEFRVIIDKYGIDWVNVVKESEEKVKKLKEIEKKKKGEEKLEEEKNKIMEGG